MNKACSSPLTFLSDTKNAYDQYHSCFRARWHKLGRSKQIKIVCLLSCILVLLTALLILLLYLYVPFFYWLPDGIPFSLDNSNVSSTRKITFLFTNPLIYQKYYNVSYDTPRYTEMTISEYHKKQEYDYVNHHGLPPVICRIKVNRVRSLDQAISHGVPIGEDEHRMMPDYFPFTMAEIRIERIYFDPGTCSFQEGDTVLCFSDDRYFGNRDDYLRPGSQYIVCISGDRQFGPFEPTSMGNIALYMTWHAIGSSDKNIRLYNKQQFFQRIKVDGEPLDKLDQFYSDLYAPYEKYWRERIIHDHS